MSCLIPLSAHVIHTVLMDSQADTVAMVCKLFEPNVSKVDLIAGALSRLTNYTFEESIKSVDGVIWACDMALRPCTSIDDSHSMRVRELLPSCRQMIRQICAGECPEMDSECEAWHELLGIGALAVDSWPYVSGLIRQLGKCVTEDVHLLETIAGACESGRIMEASLQKSAKTSLKMLIRMRIGLFRRQRMEYVAMSLQELCARTEHLDPPVTTLVRVLVALGEYALRVLVYMQHCDHGSIEALNASVLMTLHQGVRRDGYMSFVFIEDDIHGSYLYRDVVMYPDPLIMMCGCKTLQAHSDLEMSTAIIVVGGDDFVASVVVSEMFGVNVPIVVIKPNFI